MSPKLLLAHTMVQKLVIFSPQLQNSIKIECTDLLGIFLWLINLHGIVLDAKNTFVDNLLVERKRKGKICYIRLIVFYSVRWFLALHLLPYTG